MKKTMILGATLLVLAALLVLAGCGGGDETAADTQSAAETVQDVAPAPESASEAAPAPEAGQVAVHDCAGGCGMTGMPEDKMTEIGGKWYCPGCAKKMQAEGGEASHGDG